MFAFLCGIDWLECIDDVVIEKHEMECLVNTNEIGKRKNDNNDDNISDGPTKKLCAWKLLTLLILLDILIYLQYG